MRSLQRYLLAAARARPTSSGSRFAGTAAAAAHRLARRARSSLRYWSEQGHEKEALLGGVMEFLIPRKYLIAIDPGWNDWDLEVHRGIWSKARLTVAVENHGGTKRLLQRALRDRA